MKILQICNKVPFPPKDGGALAVWNLSTGLVRHGADLYVLALNTSKHSVAKIQIPEEFRKKIMIDSTELNTEISYLDLFTNLVFESIPYNLKRFKSEDFSKKIITAILDFQPEIVLLEGLALASYIPVIRKNSTAKLVMRAHNVEHIIWQGLLKEEKSPITRIYLNNLTKRIRKFEIGQLKNYDALLPISVIDEKWFLRFGYKGPSLTIPFGIDIKNLPEDKDEYLKNDLIYIGALDWAPNLEGLRWFVNEVWPNIRTDFPELQFHVAGRNPSDEVRNLLNMDGIKFYGEIENVSELMKKGRIMIIPLFSGSGMRVKIIEGLQAGKLVITTQQGLEGIPAKAGEHLLVANTIHEFTTQIHNSIKKPEDLAKICLNGQKFVEQNFNNFVISKKLTEFFNSLIE